MVITYPGTHDPGDLSHGSPPRLDGAPEMLPCVLDLVRNGATRECLEVGVDDAFHRWIALQEFMQISADELVLFKPDQCQRRAPHPGEIEMRIACPHHQGQIF